MYLSLKYDNDESVNSNNKPIEGGVMLTIPKKLLLGSATAATQIEGGDFNSNWYHWSLAGKIANNESSIVAADHYNRYPEDIQIMNQLNQEIYRMSIEWSRIEPVKGVWSQEGIDHYKDEMAMLLKSGIQPLVTLHHFSCPEWLQKEGAWVNPDTVERFLIFTEKVVLELGNMVSEYCTINEPNVFVTDTYMDAKYPPGHKDDIKSYFKASKNLILAHLKAYKLIHKIRAEHHFSGVTKVGIAHHLAHFEVDSKNPLTHLSKKLMDFSFHDLFTKGMIDGKLSMPLGIGYPEGKGQFCDFIGVNYYSRHIIKSTMNPAMLFGEVTVDESLPESRKNDLGWEIYPKGLSSILKKLYKDYPLPIYITENGIPDAHDTKRAQFIYEHLKELVTLIDEGIDIRRYYHWSLLDNLEWNDGFGPRFGLVEVDYNTLKRTIRQSGKFYGELIKHRYISKEMKQTYNIKEMSDE